MTAARPTIFAYQFVAKAEPNHLSLSPITADQMRNLTDQSELRSET